MWQRLLAFLIDITMASLLFTLVSPGMNDLTADVEWMLLLVLLCSDPDCPVQCWRDVPWSMFDDMDIASDWSFEAMELRVVAQVVVDISIDQQPRLWSLLKPHPHPANPTPKLDEMTMSFFFEDLLLYYITLFIYESAFLHVQPCNGCCCLTIHTHKSPHKSPQHCLSGCSAGRWASSCVGRASRPCPRSGVFR